ncbi:hypothetical protein EDB83DRAFT_2408892 [Lactarius deliciosus]|nr:hypothetical protein EDB83DRAFT_2433518 [Lactarius deliciosus]KAH9041904.1 hypothetical protein EDB83DRAFT_2408892 [Lactarius deliciosus]
MHVTVVYLVATGTLMTACSQTISVRSTPVVEVGRPSSHVIFPLDKGNQINFTSSRFTTTIPQSNSIQRHRPYVAATRMLTPGDFKCQRVLAPNSGR